jgi:hypothetical protein
MKNENFLTLYQSSRDLVVYNDENDSRTNYLKYLFDKISESYSLDFVYKILSFVESDLQMFPTFQESQHFIKRYYHTLYCQRIYFSFYYWNQKRLKDLGTLSHETSVIVEFIVGPIVRFWYLPNAVVLRTSSSMQFHLCADSAFRILVMTETIKFSPLLSVKENADVISLFIMELKKKNISLLCCQQIMQGNSSLFRLKLAQNRISFVCGIPSKTINSLLLVSGARLLPCLNLTTTVEIPYTFCGVLKKVVYRSIYQKEIVLFTGFSSSEEEEIKDDDGSSFSERSPLFSQLSNSFSRMKCISTLLISHLPCQSFHQISQLLMFNESPNDIAKSSKALELQYIVAQARSYLRNLK